MSQDPSPPPSVPETWTVRRVIEWTTSHLKKYGSETPRLDAEVLLAHARGCQRIQLYTAYDEPLPDDVRATMRDMVQRRAKSEPVAYLVGHREFFSLDFRVSRDVLIPRPDTETLVIEVIEAAKLWMSPNTGSLYRFGLCGDCCCQTLLVSQDQCRHCCSRHQFRRVKYRS